MKAIHIAYVAIAILLCTTSVFGYMAFFAERSIPTTEEVNVLFAWLIQAENSPFYVAKDLGYFAEEGLSVNLYRGYGSSVTAQAIGTGKYDYGETFLLNFLQLKEQGADLKSIFVESQIAGDMWISLKEKGIVTPKDAEGHTFALTAGSGDDLNFPIFCRMAGINESSIQRVYVAAGSEVSAMLSGQADICPSILGSNYPTIVQKAADVGKELNTIVWADYGVKSVGHMIVTRNAVIENKSDQVRRLVYSLARATDWTFRHPADALAIFLKYNPDLGGSNANITTAQFYQWMEFKGNTSYTRANGWGTFDPAAVQLTVNITGSTMGFNVTRYTNDVVYTEQFLPRPPYTWPD